MQFIKGDIDVPHPTAFTSSTLKSNDQIVFANCIFIAMVMLLHQGGYSHSPLTYIRKYSPLSYYVFIQRMAVGGFLFLSGYKMAKSNRGKNPLVFIRSRLLRIHPLYCSAVLTYAYVVCPIVYTKAPSLKNVIIHLFGIQMVLPVYGAEPYFPALWFVSAIYVCYLLFLLSRKYIYSLVKLSFICALFVCSILMVRNSSEYYGYIVFDLSLVDYIMFFFVGIAFSEYEKRNIQVSAVSCFGLFAVSYGMFLLFYNSVERNVTWLPAIVFLRMVLVVPCTVIAIIGVFHAGRRLRFSARQKIGLKTVSYATFGMFLFHRQVWALMERVWPERSVSQFIYISILGYPVIFAVGYFIQKMYSSLEVAVKNRWLIGLQRSS